MNQEIVKIKLTIDGNIYNFTVKKSKIYCLFTNILN